MKSVLKPHFSTDEFMQLMDLSYRSLACNETDNLKRLILDLNGFFEFDHAVCAQGNVLQLLQEDHEAPDIAVCDVSYPAEYLELYLKNRYYDTDAVFCEFISTLSPVNWLAVDKKCGFNYPASVKALDFNMRDGWTHGTIDPASMNCVVFFFGGPVAERSERIVNILEYIVPFFAEAYSRVLRRTAKPTCRLTSREVEVLNWLKAGKSSWEISMILRISKRCVDFHVNNIKTKLNAVNRAQAVAIGLHYGIIGF